MAIYLYNSITRKKEEFKPIDEGKVKMYVCGPTVYGQPHVGHARSYVDFDVIRRYFMWSGYDVKYVQNITDVGHLVGDTDEGEDKILSQAKKENVDPYALAYRYENMYFDAMDKLKVLRPTISVRATGVIPEIIDMIQKIIDRGYAYKTSEGNVYFSLGKVNGYGKLSGRKIEDSLSGERIEIASDKENNEDCALWKAATGGHIMKWNSPWGVGYPGWHIECSAISKKYLGDTFDIHGGGLDNVFPHHETEIAQSEIANGKPFVHYFLHNNLVTVNGTKMGKSLGNFITLDDLFKRFRPALVRFFILQFHYRKPVDFSFEALDAVSEQFGKICENLGAIKVLSGGVSSEITDAELKNIKENFEKAMSDDFNTPLSISELIKFSKVAGKIVQSGDSVAASEAMRLISMFEEVLGFDFTFQKIESGDASDEKKLLNLILEIREKLRSDKNYELSDFIRDKLVELDISVKDKKI